MVTGMFDGNGREGNGRDGVFRTRLCGVLSLRCYERQAVARYVAVKSNNC